VGAAEGISETINKIRLETGIEGTLKISSRIPQPRQTI